MKEIKTYTTLILIFLLLIWVAYTIELKRTADNPIVEIVNAEVSGNEIIIYEEKIVPYIITENLPTDYNHKKEMVHMFLRSIGETENDIATWDRIIQQESKYNEHSVAPTYWSQCSDGGFIELIDHGNGVMWQDSCANYGLDTIESGYSNGLLHIIAPTIRAYGCATGNWMDELTCGKAIKDSSGFSQWASY